MSKSRDSNISENTNISSVINTKENIMRSALVLFTQKGYDAVGVQELCGHAGVSKPTLYYYFGSKEGIFCALLDFHFDKLNALADRYCVYQPHPDDYDRDIYPVLMNITLAYFQYVKENPEFYAMVLGSVLAYRSGKAAMMINDRWEYQHQAFYRLFSDIAGVHSHMKERVHLLSHIFMGVINTCISLWFRKEADLDDSFARAAVRQFMHGIHA